MTVAPMADGRLSCSRCAIYQEFSHTVLHDEMSSKGEQDEDTDPPTPQGRPLARPLVAKAPGAATKTKAPNATRTSAGGARG